MTISYILCERSRSLFSFTTTRIFYSSKMLVITIFIGSRKRQLRKSNGSRKEIVANFFECIEEFLITAGTVVNIANKFRAACKSLEDILARILLEVLQEFLDHLYSHFVLYIERSSGIGPRRVCITKI